METSIGKRRSGDLLAHKARLPEHAVFRAFAQETVVLNVKSGTYHGLNPTAGRMLEVLDDAESVGAAVRRLAREYGMPPEQIQPDVIELLKGLLERGLIEVVNVDAA